MKNIFIVLIFIASAFTSKAQDLVTGYFADTLANAETIYVYLGSTQTAAGSAKINESGALNLVLETLQLSGTAAATGSIEYSMDSDGTTWYTHAAISAVTGSSVQTQLFEDAVFASRKARIKIVGSGTQSTRVRLFYCFKAAN